ncbi:MAG: hypothetical protein QNJ41_25995 [Xenococcaceae cyanobacterium MO_188.B32]|nr:hypothetical protein [Xenococcaceae cyanobacterium MO_188.B32]
MYNKLTTISQQVGGTSKLRTSELKRDYAHQMKYLVDERYPQADKIGVIHLVWFLLISTTVNFHCFAVILLF